MEPLESIPSQMQHGLKVPRFNNSATKKFVKKEFNIWLKKIKKEFNKQISLYK
jgi:hypothetical protein